MKTFRKAENEYEEFKVDGITPSTIYYTSLLTGIEYEMPKAKFDRLRNTGQIVTEKS